MKFSRICNSDVYEVQSDVNSDSRGLFYRAWCTHAFGQSAAAASFVQASISVTLQRNTVRGLHLQREPSREGKLVRCIRGEVFDVCVDVRPDSPNFGRHASIQLKAHDGRAVFIPPGFAHGFQTLTDNAEILYMMTDTYQPDLAAGILWNDPELKIKWPLADPMINDRDASLPTLASFHQALRSQPASPTPQERTDT